MIGGGGNDRRPLASDRIVTADRVRRAAADVGGIVTAVAVDGGSFGYVNAHVLTRGWRQKRGRWRRRHGLRYKHFLV
jgi:hypothetical protein